jgi:Uncharacterized conserved protein
MILTTTPTIEGRTITEYKGVVFGEVIAGVDFLKDIAASLRNFVGGRSASYEEELINARSAAMGEMSDRAKAMGADAVVGIDIDYEVLGANNGMLMVTASGTAVKLG